MIFTLKMETIEFSNNGLPADPRLAAEKAASGKDEATEAFAELERGVHVALENYSNVHRGSGHNSMVSTYLFEQARDIVLEHLDLKKDKYVVIFCSPRRAELLKAQLKPGSYQAVSSQDIGLPLGVIAMAVRRKALPKGIPFHAGGGTARLVAPGWVVWAKAPDRFEAGTPAIINIIAFAKALQMVRQSGNEAFMGASAEKLSATEILYRDELEKYSGQELLAELRQTLLGRSVIVPTMEGPKPYVNLDNGASTPTFTPIWNAVRWTWRQPAERQQEIIQEVRIICAKMLGAPLADYEIIFTSNTTEAINLAAESLSTVPEKDIEPVVLNTLLEHNSNDLPWRMIPGFSLIRLPVDDDGFIDLNGMDAVLRAYNQDGQHGKQRIKLVAVSGASNVPGVFNNLAETSRIVHRYGARLLVDAAQLVAHRKVDMKASEIDYLAFSAHKVYAPFGCGVLVVRKGLLNFSTAEMVMIQSSGEENPGGIAALGKSLLLLQRIGLDLIAEEEQALTKLALKGLAQIDGLKIYGIKDPDSPGFTKKGGVIVFSLKGIMPDQLAKKLAEQRGIGVRFGCHCAHLLVKHLLKISPPLERFQGIIVRLFPRLNLPGIVRVSLGIENTKEEIDTLIQTLTIIAVKKQKKGASRENEISTLTQTEVQKQMKDFAREVGRKVYN
jgi:selenocysteine lyase/cysteine desulfurase